MLILVVESVSFYRFNYHEVSFLRINRQLIGCSGVSKFLMISILGLLTVGSVYRLQVLRFIHLWHQGLLPDAFDNMFQEDSTIHGYITRYSAERKRHKSKVRANIGKQSVSFVAIDKWKDQPSSLKNASAFAFLKHAKYYFQPKKINK